MLPFMDILTSMTRMTVKGILAVKTFSLISLLEITRFLPGVILLVLATAATMVEGK